LSAFANLNEKVMYETVMHYLSAAAFWLNVAFKQPTIYKRIWLLNNLPSINEI